MHADGEVGVVGGGIYSDVTTTRQCDMQWTEKHYSHAHVHTHTHEHTNIHSLHTYGHCGGGGCSTNWRDGTERNGTMYRHRHATATEQHRLVVRSHSTVRETARARARASTEIHLREHVVGARRHARTCVVLCSDASASARAGERLGGTGCSREGSPGMCPDVQ